MGTALYIMMPKFVFFLVVFLLISHSNVGVEATVNCDCNYHSGGCLISSTAPPGLACRCVYRGFWTCSGTVVGCVDEQHIKCLNPGYDKASCLQGSGNCGAYRN